MSKVSLATMYGVGLVKFAPGTAGSLVAALLAWGILQLPDGWAILAVGTILFTVLGTRSATRYMAEHDTAHDPSEIVIDELAGQWLTYLICAVVLRIYFYAHSSDDILSLHHGYAIPALLLRILSLFHGHILPVFLLLGFILFRLFDIIKPWPISWFDNHIHGGWGVMADDLVAAIPAGILLSATLVYLIITTSAP